MNKQSDGKYLGAVDNIAAKELDDTVYVAAVYTSGGVEYSTGVLAYSIGKYCQTMGNNGSDVQSLARAAAVYGYYANAYFDN